MPSVLICFILWTCMVSGCLGGALGMWLVMRQQRRTGQPVEVSRSALPEELASQHEVNSLLRSLLKINSQVDERVGKHSHRIEEITEAIENESDRESLVRSANLLVIANQQLQKDLDHAKSDLQHQRELVDSFKHDSNTDVLTQLLNRRAFNVDLDASLEESRRDQKPLSLLFVDIDHFKIINDVHGHLNGDQVLLTVAQCLKNSLRVPASVCRYGGEEFAIILPGIAARKALAIAEDLRQSVENCRIDIERSTVAVTVSIGVAEATLGASRSELLERSDKALFSAKNAGRNQCCCQDRIDCRPPKLLAVAGYNEDRSRNDCLTHS